jgi:hypothetical protein
MILLFFASDISCLGCIFFSFTLSIARCANDYFLRTLFLDVGFFTIQMDDYLLAWFYLGDIGLE